MFLRVSRAESDACPPGRIACSPTAGGDVPSSNNGTDYSSGRPTIHRYIGVVMVACLAFLAFLGYIYFAHWRWRKKKWWCCGPRRPPELYERKKRVDRMYDEDMDSVKGIDRTISLSPTTTAHAEEKTETVERGRGRSRSRGQRQEDSERRVDDGPLIDLKAIDDRRRRDRREREESRRNEGRSSVSAEYERRDDGATLDFGRGPHGLDSLCEEEDEDDWDYDERRRKRRPKQKIMPDKPEVVKQVSGGLVFFAEVPKPIVPPRRDRYPQGEWEMGHVRDVRFEARTPPSFHGRTLSHDRS